MERNDSFEDVNILLNSSELTLNFFKFAKIINYVSDLHSTANF